MTERMDTLYKRLFEVKVLHHYWLDEGDVVFDNLPKPTQEQRLLSYNFRSFLSITPTTTTASILKGFGCVYKDTALGFIVAVPSSVALPADTILEFIMTVKDATFFNYTALTLRPQKIYEFFLQSQCLKSEDQPPEIKVYRYKENVPILSNLTGTTRILAGNKSLFLSKKIPARQATDLVESLVLSGNGLLQLTSDEPAAKTKQLSVNAPDLPVYVHQADVPAIVSPSGLVGAPAKEILLSSDIPDDVFAIIQLSSLRDDDDEFSFIDKSNGHAKTSHPTFQIRFKNRATIWQYLKKENVVVDAPDPDSERLPLTYYGNVGDKQKPSVGLVEARKSDGKITQIVSKNFCIAFHC